MALLVWVDDIYILNASNDDTTVVFDFKAFLDASNAPLLLLKANMKF